MADIKISELERVQSLNNGDLVEVSQEDSYSESGYSSKSAKMTDLGEKVVNGIEYTSELNTSNKKIIGAINEIASYTPVYGNTASGAIATFDTSLALPLQDCTIAINAVQESGTPTPSSPKAISGFTGANIKVVGNLLNDNKYQFSYNTLMLGESAGNTYSTYLKATTYTISFKRPTSVPFKIYYNKSGGSAIDIMTYGQTTSASFTVAEEGDYRFVAYYNSGAVAPTDISEIMLAGGSEVKPYTAYTAPTTTPISWQDEAGTVYGGSLDVTSGVLMVTHRYRLMQSDAPNFIENITANYTTYYTKLSNLYTDIKTTGFIDVVSDKFVGVKTLAGDDTNIVYIQNGYANFRVNNDDFASASDFKTWVQTNGIELVYELATPVTYQLTPTQISAIVGTNNVFTDTNGNTSVVYACSLKDYIEGQ